MMSGARSTKGRGVNPGDTLKVEQRLVLDGVRSTKAGA